MAQITLEDSRSMSTMTRWPSFDPESELDTPPDEYLTYPLRLRTAKDTNTLFTPDRLKTRTEATLVASTSASATAPKAIPLVRKHTTKELISLYESTTNTNTSHSSSNSNGVLKAPVRSSKLNLNAPLPELPQSKPLRASFKDLLSVFGKKRVTKQKHTQSRSVSPSMGRSQPNASNSALGGTNKKVLSSKTVEPMAPVPTNEPASPSTLRSGPVLYCDTSTGGEVWHRCDALLAPPALHLTWFTPSGKPATHIMSVAECRDTRSMPASQQALITAPDWEGCSSYVFEIEFEGGRTERFAAQSFRTRGEWVSSIWDAVLYSKGTFNDTGSPHDPPINLSRIDRARISTLPGSGAEPSPRALGDTLTRATISEPQETSKSLIASTVSFAPNPAQGPVPSFPLIRQDPVKSVSPIQRQDTLQISTPTPSQTTPAVPRCEASTHANSRMPSTPPQRKLTHHTASPSIKNLDRLSLVKQRLTTFDDSPERTRQPFRGNSYFTPPRTPTRPHSRPDASTSDLLVPKDEPPGLGSRLDHKNQDPFGVTNPINNTPCKSQAGPPTSTLRNLPRQKSQIALDLIPVSTRVQPIESAESFYDNYMTTGNSLEEIKGTIGGLKEGINSQSQTIGQLRDGIREMHHEVKLAIQQPPLPVPQLDDLRERMVAMAEGLHLVDVPGLHVKLEALKNDVAAFDIAEIKAYLEESRAVSVSNEPPPLPSDLAGKLNLLASKENVEDVIIRLEKLQKEGFANIPLILEKVEALKEHVSTAAGQTVAKIEATEAPPAATMDLSSVHAKLDTISTLANSLMEQRKVPSSPPPTISPLSALRNLSVFKNTHKASDPDSQQLNDETASGPSISPDVLEILTLVKEDRDQRAIIANQFGDSVRYLNELNTWMESFVTNTYGSFQAMSAGVEQLCKELALPTEVEDGTPIKPESIGTTIGDIRRLIDQGGQKQQQFEAIQTSVALLTQQVNIDLQQRAEANARQNQVLETLVTLLENQRQDQEVLLRGVASALSADIRGERLRFVEAMQNATTVNVQLHIDEFKQQLAKEVTLMLQEVGHKSRVDLTEAGYGAQQVQMAQVPVAMHQPVVVPNQYLHVHGMAATWQHHPSNGGYAERPLPSPRPNRRKA